MYGGFVTTINSRLSPSNCDYQKPVLKKIQFFDDFDRDKFQFIPLEKKVKSALTPMSF